MTFLRYVLFIPLQILFIPVAIFGIVLVTYKQMVVSKRLGISQTAIEILNGRWTMHLFKMRRDEASAKLAAVIPNTSVFGLKLTLLPLWFIYKLLGKLFLYPRVPQTGAEKLVDLVIARTLYFDRIIERVITEVEQFVVLGAGYDARAYGICCREGVTCFELDQIKIQQYKLAALQAAGVPHEHVRFMGIDFSRDKVFEKLGESGYDPAKKTLFLWEGVTLYLAEADVRRTVQDVRQNAAAGSVLLTDIYADKMIHPLKRATGKKTLEYTSETVDFSLDFATDSKGVLTGFVESEGMAVGETFFLGSRSEKGPFAVVVEMQLKDT